MVTVEMRSMSQLQLFDYAKLDAETRIVGQQRARDIAQRQSQIIENILANGHDFADMRDRLRHNKSGGFEGWLIFHGWDRRHAYRYIQAWEQFGNCDNLPQLSIDASALYLLGAPSTPEPARQEALALAEKGEQITHTKAKEITERHRETTSTTHTTTERDDIPPPLPGLEEFIQPDEGEESEGNEPPELVDEEREREREWRERVEATTEEEREYDRKSEAHRLWLKTVYELYRLINSVNDLGGVKTVAAKWDDAGREAMIEKLKDVSQELDSWLRHLERKDDEDE